MVFIPTQQSATVCSLMTKMAPFYSFMQFGSHKTRLETLSKNKEMHTSVKHRYIGHLIIKYKLEVVECL